MSFLGGENNGVQNIVAPMVTINGDTAGSYKWTMPFQGSSYKKVIVYFDNFEESANQLVITFPVPFVSTPALLSTPQGISGNITATEITLPQNTNVQGFLILEGF